MQDDSTTRPARRNAGQFRTGHDPRRHKFTREECQRGFWAAIDSIIARYPDAVTTLGRHIACNALPALIGKKARSENQRPK